jgi:hypothetical protein
VCEICRKGFAQSTTFKRHKSTHAIQKTYECDICRKYFSRKDSMAQHKRKSHSNLPWLLQSLQLFCQFMQTEILRSKPLKDIT